MAVDLKLVKEGATVQPDGKMKITLPVANTMMGAKYIEIFRMDDTTKEFTSLGVVAVKDGKFTMETDHFSTYVFAAADAPTETTTETTTVATSVETGDTSPIAVTVLFAVLGLVCFVITFSKKEENA